MATYKMCTRTGQVRVGIATLKVFVHEARNVCETPRDISILRETFYLNNNWVLIKFLRQFISLQIFFYCYLNC